MSKFIVAQYADEVNESYIRAALIEAYGGTDYRDKFSDKLVRVLLSDYKLKAKNLAWYFADKDGRVRNYKQVTADPEKLLANAIKDISKVEQIVKVLKGLGASYSAEQFLNNRCNYKGQEQKISKVITNRDLKTPYDSTIARNTSKSNLIVRRGDKKLLNSALKYFDNHVLNYSDSELMFITSVIPAGDLTLEVKDPLTTLSKDEIEAYISSCRAENLTISMDLMDMITCSTGSASSCLSVGNIHAAGSIQNFRTDFAVIAFTSKPADRFIKSGRAWVFMRALERGHIREFPFWKQQRSYGNVKKAHQKLLNEEIKEKLAILIPGQKWEEYGHWPSLCTSLNVLTDGTGKGHTRAAGHLDISNGDEINFFIPKGKSGYLNHTRELLLPFADMLNLQGEISNIVSFHRDVNDSDYWGAMEPNNYEVTCSVTNTIVLDRDAVEVDGKWIRKDVLPQLIAGEKKESVVLKDDGKEFKASAENLEDIEVDEDDF